MSESRATKFLVVKVLDEFRVVLNKGSADGVKHEDRFLLYEIGEALCDPDTKVDLGRLEVVKGTGEPVHIQERMTTIKSNQYTSTAGTRTITKRSSLVFPTSEEVSVPGAKVRQPFSSPKVGDSAKLISDS